MQGFLKTLSELHRGNLIAQLDEKMREVVEAVRAEGRQGTLTLTIKIKPASKHDDDKLHVTPSVQAKPPEPALGDDLVYAAADQTLQRRDPKQMDLDQLREVPGDGAGQQQTG